MGANPNTLRLHGEAIERRRTGVYSRKGFIIIEGACGKRYGLHADDVDWFVEELRKAQATSREYLNRPGVNTLSPLEKVFAE